MFTGLLSTITVLTLFNGCHHSSRNNDINITEPTVKGVFIGNKISYILDNLSQGFLSTAGGDILGDFLYLLGWGDPSNDLQNKTLEDIDSKIRQIHIEITAMTTELKSLMHEIQYVDYDIKETVDWPRTANGHIYSVSRDLLLKRDGNKKAGEGNRTEIRAFAKDILDPNNGIRFDVDTIFEAIQGNDTPILQNHVNKALSRLHSYNDEDLPVAYKSFEYFTSIALENQVAGVNLVVEAHRAQDQNKSAKTYLDCFTGKATDCGVVPELYEEVLNMDNNYSFINNAVRLVLENAPLHDLHQNNTFLPDSAESILKRAEFYSLLVGETNTSKFGLHLFHISTKNMPEAPNTILVQSKQTQEQYLCNATRHSVTGRMYDYWEKNEISPKTEYNIVDYNCGALSDGTYIIPKDLSTPSIPREVKIERYNQNYDKNSSGIIHYGFALLTSHIDNRFNQSSPKWSIYKEKDKNYNSETKGDANDWPIITKANHSHEESVDTESMARMELQGHFKFTGTQDTDHPTTITVSYHTGFYMQADAPFTDSEGGSDAWSTVNIGIWDEKHKKIIAQRKPIELHADTDHPHLKHNPKDVYGTFTFTPEENVNYYIFFTMTSKECCSDNAFAMTNLNNVFDVFIDFSEK